MAKPKKLKELLSEILTEEEISIMPTSFDIVGDILIFADFPLELKKKEKGIAEKILEVFKNVKVVCKKVEEYSGTFRTPKLEIIGGEDRKETIHKENGIRVKLDVEKVYFSVRLGHERERINHLVKKSESVLVMFSGCGVYPVNLSRNTEAKEIYGIEINPVGHRYALENVKLNKAENITLFEGDVNLVLPGIKKKFDRILMPLPKSAEDFLDLAISKLKKKGILHFYDFLNEKEFDLAEEKISLAVLRKKKKVLSYFLVRCGDYGPGKYRVCADVQIE